MKASAANAKANVASIQELHKMINANSWFYWTTKVIKQ
jgi:hypothetical protein